MKKSNPLVQIQFLIFSFLLLTSCHGQGEMNISENNLAEANAVSDENQIVNELLGPMNVKNPAPDPALQIVSWVSKIFQDKNGNFWFGTIGRGAIYYDALPSDEMEKFT